MCLIVRRPKGAKEIHERWIADFMEKNGDGFGIWWVQDGVVKVNKTLTKKEVVPLVREAEARDVEFGMHFRMATHGAVSLENVHPYPVFTLKGRPESLASVCAHNGVLSEWGGVSGTGRSDTSFFVDEALVPLAQAFGLDALYDKNAPVQRIINKLLGFGNRLLLTDNDIGFCELGKDWIIWRGLSLSNTYAWSYAQRDQEVPSHKTFFRQAERERAYPGAQRYPRQVPLDLSLSSRELSATELTDNLDISVPSNVVRGYILGPQPPLGIPSLSPWETQSTTSTSSGGRSTTASPRQSERSYASEYGHVWRPVEGNRATASQSLTPSGASEGSLGEEDHKVSKKRERKSDRIDLDDESGSYLGIIASMNYTELVDWCQREPEEAATIIQELIWQEAGMSTRWE